MTPEQKAKMKQARINSFLPNKPEEKIPSLIESIKPFDMPMKDEEILINEESKRKKEKAKIKAEKKQNEIKENYKNLIEKINNTNNLIDGLNNEKGTTIVHGRKTRIDEELRILRKERRELTLH